MCYAWFSLAFCFSGLAAAILFLCCLLLFVEFSVSSVLCQEIGCEECLRNDLILGRVGRITLTLSINQHPVMMTQSLKTEPRVKLEDNKFPRNVHVCRICRLERSTL